MSSNALKQSYETMRSLLISHQQIGFIMSVKGIIFHSFMPQSFRVSIPVST